MFATGRTKDNQSKSKAERLFDALIKPSIAEMRRVGLSELSTNTFGTSHSPSSPNGKRLSESPKKTATGRTRRKAAAKVRFDTADEVIVFTPPVGRKKPKKPPPKKGNLRSAVEEAFLKANLPDFDEIAKHELFVSVEDPTRPYHTEDQDLPTTPRMEDLLNPFQDVVDWQQLTDSERKAMRATARTKQQAEKRQSSAVVEDSLMGRLDVTTTAQVKESTPIRGLPRCPAKRPFTIRAPRGTKASVSSSIPVHLSAEFVNRRPREVRKAPSSTLLPPSIELSDSELSPTFLSVGNGSPAISTRRSSLRISSRRSNELPSQMSTLKVPNSVAGLLTSTPSKPPTCLGQKSSVFRMPTNHSMAQSTFHTACGPDLTRTMLFKSRPTCAASIRCISIRNQSVASVATARTLISNRSANMVVPSEQLRSVLHETMAAAFGETRCILADGQEELVGPIKKVLALCSPSEETEFETVFDEGIMKNLIKIGEGSYGEIYKSVAPDGQELVLKLVPCSLELDIEEAFEKILPEIVISQKFNALRQNSYNQTPNFINLSRTACLRGSFPEKLIQEWDKFDKAKGSENLDPREYDDNHLHVVMMLNNGGTDLEKYKFKSSLEAFSIFQQVAYSLAAAECQYEFEHRDLHWGNVLVMDRGAIVEDIDYCVNGLKFTVKTCGVFASLIDFTLSRLSEGGVTVYDDLSQDEELFQGKGDYQFDIYRKMREENENCWETFTPKTNIFWLDYMLDKLINEKKYRSRSAEHRRYLEIMKELRQTILSHSSAEEFVRSTLSSLSLP